MKCKVEDMAWVDAKFGTYQFPMGKEKKNDIMHTKSPYTIV